MNLMFIFLWMVFMHIVDDYYLQGFLAQAKQKKWWQDNYPNELYKHDYIWALVMHSFSWTFMIMLPIAVYESFNLSILFIIAFLFNILIHGYTDDCKANKLKINLIQDQSIHIAQIAITFVLLVVL